MLESYAVTFFSCPGVDDMRVFCPECKTKATIYSRTNLAEGTDAVYCRCVNSDCKKHTHSFVLHVSFSHFVEPRAAALQLTLSHLFEQLPAQDRADMLKQLTGSLSS